MTNLSERIISVWSMQKHQRTGKIEFRVGTLWVKLDWVAALVSCELVGSNPSDSLVKTWSSPCDSLVETGSKHELIRCSWVCVYWVTNACVAVPLLSVGSNRNSCCLSKLCSSSDDFLAKVVTWLILPVVICLSQRLSHACLSISTCTVKLRMAH